MMGVSRCHQVSWNLLVGEGIRQPTTRLNDIIVFFPFTLILGVLIRVSRRRTAEPRRGKGAVVCSLPAQ